MAALDPDTIFGHVKDATEFHFPFGYHVSIPQPFYDEATKSGFIITKFMVLEVAIAIILVLIFVPLAIRMRRGAPPKGRWWNLMETFLLFIRDNVARPSIGEKEADRFLPFLWTAFFFVLGMNLMGMLPWMGSPTGDLSATLALAIGTFLVVTLSGMRRFGPIGFWTGMVPHMDISPVMAIFVKPMILGIEIMGMFIKHLILAVRLLANMYAGHLVLSVIMTFIVVSLKLNFFLASGITLSSLFGATCLSLLELFVAFLQAYVFTFLSALFIGMAIHEH